MKAVTINEALFLKALKQISRTVATEQSRPTLSRCRLEVSESQILFMSCDGYRATRVSYNHNQPNVEAFACSFDAFSWKLSKGLIREVSIHQEDGVTTFEYEDNGSRVERHFKYSYDFIDLNKIMSFQDEPTVRVSFDAALLKAVLPDFIGAETVRNSVTFNVRQTATGVMLTAPANDELNTEVLVLPIRTFER